MVFRYQSLHAFHQIMDEIDVEKCQLKTLDICLSSSLVDQFGPLRPYASDEEQS